MPMFWFRPLLLAGAIAALTSGAEAAVVFNNMGTNMPLNVSGVVADSQDGPLFASFTAPTANSSTLTELRLLLSAGNDAGGIMVTVFDDFPTSPSSPLSFTFVSDSTINAIQGANGWATIDIPDAVPLLDQDCQCNDHRFWIGVADAQDAGNITTIGGVTPSDPFDPSVTTSAVWANDGNNSFPFEWNFVNSNDPQENLNQDTNAFVMCVVVDGSRDQTGACAAPVPEPQSFGLIGLALAGLGLIRRRRGA